MPPQQPHFPQQNDPAPGETPATVASQHATDLPPLPPLPPLDEAPTVTPPTMPPMRRAARLTMPIHPQTLPGLEGRGACSER